MNLNEYQEIAYSKKFYQGVPGFDSEHPVYYTLGLTEEAGEVVGNIKKALRDDGGVITPERKEKIKKELGDVLWYLAVLAKVIGIPLEDVAKGNIEKTQGRIERGTQSGSGDDR